MSFTKGWLPVVILAVAALAFVGCAEDGEQGPEGPQGPAGPPGSGGPETFLGKMGEPCLHCHSTVVEQWSQTNHVEAYTGLSEDRRENPYCLQCHTTGWDTEYAYDGSVVEEGTDEYGYDDYFGVETAEAEARRMELEGVQCEACHGPMGPQDEFGSKHGAISFSTRMENGESTSLCMPCHEGQLEEWVTSGHAMAAGGDWNALQNEHYAHVSSCQACHVSEGFIAANDPAYADYDFGHEVSFIGCVTCHDPHEAVNPAHLRNVGDVVVAFFPEWAPDDEERPAMSGYGAGQVCAQCHHGRRDDANVANQIANGYGHFGPHSSPQMDMFIGAGSWEIDGYTYERETAHHIGDGAGIEDACVSCHMIAEAEMHGNLEDHVFHNFIPGESNCERCHSGGIDIAAMQANIQTKMDDLAVALGYTDAADFDANFDSQADGVTVAQREAAYALVFVMSDGSIGIHNPEYAESLLDNAIAYLQSL